MIGTPIRLFASHDWGVDSKNHDRVRTVVQMLGERGFHVWFDETHMKGNILDAMCRGIDDAEIVLVFVTRNYISKVERGDEGDNVRREFMYAKDKPEKLLPIRFESTLPSHWSGPVGMVLGSSLYTDLSTVDDPRVDELATAIRKRISSGKKRLWKTALHGAAQLRKAESQTVVTELSVCGEGLDMRQRVSRALTTMGDRIKDGEHTRDAVDRILASILEPSNDVKTMPFFERVRLLEEQLGLAR